jgi:5S rRNA maturation endonuclease (ribonuclease M5)
MILDEYTRDRQAIVTALLNAGAKPGKKNTFHCPFHNDSNPSSWIKKSEVSGRYYWTCGKCHIYYDVIALEALTKGVEPAELIREKFGKAQPYQTYYKSLEELVGSIDGIVEEVNPYTNPENGNLDLVTIRYYERGSGNKKFAQAYQSPDGYVRKRPKGLLPLFNRTRIVEADSVIFVEGEKSVRLLTKLGFVSTTASGGSKNAEATDYSLLANKTIYLWSDNDEAGERFIEAVATHLENSDVRKVDITGLELATSDDVVDLYEKITAAGGSEEDVKNCIHALLDDALENNPLAGYEQHQEDMRSGAYVNLPIQDFPILTSEARMLLNKRIGIIYGNAGTGKSLVTGKLCDDLVLHKGIKAARLCLEDEKEEHLKRTQAQQQKRSEIVKEDWHRANPEASKLFYEEAKEMLKVIAPTIVAGENDTWDADSILQWIERQLDNGCELVVVDPVSVIMTDKIWITSHKLMWGAKRLLAKYPRGRIIFVSHNNTEGEVAGGMSYRRFSHAMFMINRYKKPKKVVIADNFGEQHVIEMHRSIGIEKARYGSGGGLEIAVSINPTTLCMEELGVVLEELKDKKPTGKIIEHEEVEL